MIHQQIFIDGELADIGENTEVTLKHESNLLNGGASFVSNHSLTVSLPATNRNRMLFGFPDIVQSTVSEAYRWHDVEYHRNGLPIVSRGRCRVMKATEESIEIALLWGMKRAVDAFLSGEKKLSDIVTDAAIEFNAQPQVTPFADAELSTTAIFYAAMDTIRYMSELEYYHLDVEFSNKQWSNTSLRGASSYLHPSVRLGWILSQFETESGVTLDFDDLYEEMPYMIVPLISRIPNDITFNGGYKATVHEPLMWGGNTGNFIRFTTVNPSPIFMQQANPPQGALVCQTAFDGLLRFSVYLYIDELVSVSYPVMRTKYGYKLDVYVNGVVQSCVMIPEGTTFMAQDRDNQGRIGFTINGSLPIKMEVGQSLSVRLTCVNNGIADIDLYGGIHVYGGNIWVNDIIGSLNEVQPTQMYPVQGNLPDIKVVDVVKFLCVILGEFPVQASTDQELIMRRVENLYNWSRAEDWSRRLLSQTDTATPESVSYTPSGWAKQNWWRWKEDETVTGDYDGHIDVDDETVEESRNVMTFPFAATDGNNIPMYTTEYKYDSETQQWSTIVKWNKVEPRVLKMEEGDNGETVASFQYDMAQIITQRYYNFAATMSKPVIIEETVRMTDLQFMALDETKPIFLAQHGGYFAMLSCEYHPNGIAKVELLRLIKQEEK